MEIQWNKFGWWILHFFLGCPDDDLEDKYRGNKSVCKKCGRGYINWLKY